MGCGEVEFSSVARLGIKRLGYSYLHCSSPCVPACGCGSGFNRSLFQVDGCVLYVCSKHRIFWENSYMFISFSSETRRHSVFLCCCIQIYKNSLDSVHIRLFDTDLTNYPFLSPTLWACGQRISLCPKGTSSGHIKDFPETLGSYQSSFVVFIFSNCLQFLQEILKNQMLFASLHIG